MKQAYISGYTELCSQVFKDMFIFRLNKKRFKQLAIHYRHGIPGKISLVWNNEVVFNAACVQMTISCGIYETDQSTIKACLAMNERNLLNDMAALDEVIVKAIDAVMQEDVFVPIEVLEEVVK